MTRAEFMGALGRSLAGLPRAELDRVREYYDELFSDGLEAGRTEEDICAGLDHPDVIAGRIRAELAFVRAEQKPSAKNTNAVLLVILGLFALPIGLPLAFALLAVLFAAAVTIISLIFAGVVVVLAMGVVGISLFVAALYTLGSGGVAAGLALLGASLVCIGLGVLGVVLCVWSLPAVIRAMTKGFHRLYQSVMGKIRGVKA